MADIRVEKKSSSMWPWILGIIAALLLIWVLFALFNNDRQPLGAAQTEQDEMALGTEDAGTGIMPGETAGTPGTAAGGTDAGIGGTAGLPDPVREFGQFVQERRLEQAMGREHEVTSQGIEQLSSALEAVAENRNMKDEMFQARTDSMENAAEQLQQEAQAANHANLTRASLLNAAQLMERMGGQAGAQADGSIQQFRQTVESIDVQQPLLDQKEEISNAFNQADQALKELARG